MISGFRVTYGGAQTLYGITPDLTVLGKIIGGGLPVGAYGGRKEIMDLIAPLGPVYQAGTLSGNPLAVSAGIETLKQLKARGVYKKLEERSAALAKGIGEAAKKAGVPLTQTRVGSMLGAFFTSGPVVDWDTAKLSDTKLYGQFFHADAGTGGVPGPLSIRSRLPLDRSFNPRHRTTRSKPPQAAFKKPLARTS